MKATMASRAGKPLSRCFAHVYPLALPALFLAAVLAAGGGFAGEVLAVAVTGARALLAASDFGLAADFFAAAFLAGFGAFASRLRPWRGFLAGLRLFLGAALGLAAALGRALVDQRDRFRQA